MPRLFAVPFYHDNLLLSKMSLATFSRLFLAADPNGGQNGAKRTSKSRGAIFGHQKDTKRLPKKTSKSHGAILDAKRSAMKKDGKRSWHLHSLQVTQYITQ